MIVGASALGRENGRERLFFGSDSDQSRKGKFVEQKHIATGASRAPHARRALLGVLAIAGDSLPATPATALDVASKMMVRARRHGAVMAARATAGAPVLGFVAVPHALNDRPISQ